jgi:hypothetical protein
MPITRANPITNAYACARNQDDVILVRDAERLGLTKWDIRSLRRHDELAMRGALTIPPVRDPLRSFARATQLLIPDAKISHTTAVRLHGVAGLDYRKPHELLHATVPRGATRWQRAGVQLHFRDVAPSEITDLDGLQVVSVLQAIRECAPILDRIRLVSIVDNALHQKLITLAELHGLIAALGQQPAVKWLRLCRIGTESPSETRVRLILVDAGLEPDHLQYIVFTEGGFQVARLDMAWTRGGARVGLEVDSAWHDRPKALYRDRDRLNDTNGLEWDVRRVTARDAHRRPGYIQHQVRQALSLQA